MYVKIIDPGKGFKTYEEQAAAGMVLTRLHGPYYNLESVSPTPEEICALFGYEPVSHEEVYPTPPPPTLDELKAAKRGELDTGYSAALFTTVDYLGKVWGNSALDQKAVDSAALMVRDGVFPPGGMHWNTYLGEEKVLLLPEEMVGLQMARFLQDKALFDRYDVLLNRLYACTTPEEVAAIAWTLTDPEPEPEPEPEVVPE